MSDAEVAISWIQMLLCLDALHAADDYRHGKSGRVERPTLKRLCEGWRTVARIADSIKRDCDAALKLSRRAT